MAGDFITAPANHFSVVSIRLSCLPKNPVGIAHNPSPHLAQAFALANLRWSLQETKGQARTTQISNVPSDKREGRVRQGDLLLGGGGGIGSIATQVVDLTRAIQADGRGGFT